MNKRPARLALDADPVTGRGKPCPDCGHPKSRHTRAYRPREYFECDAAMIAGIHQVSDQHRHGLSYRSCGCRRNQQWIEQQYQRVAQAVPR